LPIRGRIYVDGRNLGDLSQSLTCAGVSVRLVTQACSLSCQTVFQRFALPDTAILLLHFVLQSPRDNQMIRRCRCPLVDDFAMGALRTRDLRRSLREPMFECRNWKRVHQVAGLMREKIYNRELMLIFVALTVAGCLMTAGAVLALGRLLSDDDGVAIGMPGSGGQPASSAQHRAKSAKKAEFAADRIGL
jgi:hypothetical protein